MPEFTSDWFSKNENYWKKLFYSIGWQSDLPKVIVEIGSYEGRSTLWSLKNLLHDKQSKIYCIDTFEGGIEHTNSQMEGCFVKFVKNIKESEAAGKVTICCGRSRTELLKLAASGVSADFVYVDGSHEAADVLEDAVISFCLLKTGGIMIFDDYNWNSRAALSNPLLHPKPAIDAFVNNNLSKLYIIPEQPLYQLAVKKLRD